LRLAYLLCGDRHRAEDLVQETLLSAYRQWGRVERADDPDAYVRRMLVNAHLSWRRRLSSTERPVSTVRERAAPGDLSADVVTRDLLWRLLAELPIRQRTVLVLRHYEHLDDQQIATVLHCAQGTVRSLASRAAASLRTHPELGAELGVEPPKERIADER